MSDFVVDAVLFDLDGTLVDSTAGVERGWRAMAPRLGVPFSTLEPYLHGIPAPQVFELVAPGLSRAEIAKLADVFLEEQALDTDDAMPIPGALSVLDGLPSTRWAIVTSGNRQLATARIRAGHIPPPRVLITADDVLVGKPDPAPYLAGAAALGVPAARCLVVEDAPAGVASGLAAGMPVLGVLTTHEDLPGAARLVHDLSAVEMHADRLGVHVTIRG